MSVCVCVCLCTNGLIAMCVSCMLVYLLLGSLCGGLCMTVYVLSDHRVYVCPLYLTQSLILFLS